MKYKFDMNKRYYISNKNNISFCNLPKYFKEMQTKLYVQNLSFKKQTYFYHNFQDIGCQL